MRNLFCGVVAVAMLFCAVSVEADTPPPTKKAPAKKTTKKAAVAPHKTGTAGGNAAASKAGTAKTATHKATGKKALPKRPAPTWRNRQVAPTPDRYREIQQALAAKGYLNREDATGAWDNKSTEALRKFQADQKLDTSGKINSLSLIALGLGPNHAAAVTAPPPPNSAGAR